MNVFNLFSGTWGQLLYELAGSYSSGQFFFLGNEPVTLQFTSDGSVTYPGFNVRFYMGEQSPGKVMGQCACKISLAFDGLIDFLDLPFLVLIFSTRQTLRNCHFL